MSRTKPGYGKKSSTHRSRLLPSICRSPNTLSPSKKAATPAGLSSLVLVPLAVEHGLVWEQGLGLVEATVGPINRRLSTSKANSGPYAVATPRPARSRAPRTRSTGGHKPGEIGMGHWGATNPRRSVRRMPVSIAAQT